MISIKEALVDFLKQNKGSVAGYLFFSLATPISNIYLPHLYGQIIAAINEKGTIDREVKIRFACIFMLWILVQMFWSAMNVIDSKFIPNLRRHVRKYIVEKVLDTYREDYSEEELGSIMAELVRIPDEVAHLFGNIRNHILPMIFMLTFSVGYFTWTNPKLGLVSIAAIGSYMTVAVQYSKKCIPAWSEMNDSHQVLHNELNDCLGNLLNIYTANQDKEELVRIDGYEDHFLEKNRKTIRCTGNFRMVLNLSYIFLFCSINVLSFYLFTKKVMKLSEVVSVLIISLELISKMAGFVGAIDKIMYEFATLDHFQKKLDLLGHRRVLKTQALQQHPDLRGDIVYDGVSLDYGGIQALKNVNLSIKQGSTTVLVGEIGSGKTSIINALIRLVPVQGKVTINGYDIKDTSLDHLRNNILYVPQNPRLFNRTVYENIAYGSNVSRDNVLETLHQYGIDIDIDKKVGKYGQWLSGGQRQIVYLLRCLFRDSPIVVLDEPTASLDHATKESILGILYDLLVNRTVIIISHDPDILKYADTIVEMKRGEIL